MGAARIPGPVDGRHGGIDAGTMARVRSPMPGVVGMGGVGQRVRRRPVRGGTPPVGDEVRVVSLAFYLIHPTHVDYMAQFRVANEVFACCHVGFTLAQVCDLDPALSWVVIGLDYTVEGDWDPHSEQNEVARMFMAEPGRVHVFFVRDTGLPAAMTVDHLSDVSHHLNLGERIYISDEARADTLAHELGHLLLNEGADWRHENEVGNLMSEGTTRTGQQLTEQQRRIIYQNARGATGSQARQ